MAGFSGERRVSEEAEHAQSVVDRDENDALRRERCAVRRAAGTDTVAASVNPDHDRQRLGDFPRGPDVEEEAVLALRHGSALWTGGSGRGRLANAVPRDHWCGWTPAQIGDRRGCGGDALESDDGGGRGG